MIDSVSHTYNTSTSEITTYLYLRNAYTGVEESKSLSNDMFRNLERLGMGHLKFFLSIIDDTGCVVRFVHLKDVCEDTEDVFCMRTFKSSETKDVL